MDRQLKKDRNTTTMTNDLLMLMWGNHNQIGSGKIIG